MRYDVVGEMDDEKEEEVMVRTPKYLTMEPTQLNPPPTNNPVLMLYLSIIYTLHIVPTQPTNQHMPDNSIYSLF